VFIAGVFGAMTVSRRILVVQGASSADSPLPVTWLNRDAPSVREWHDSSVGFEAILFGSPGLEADAKRLQSPDEAAAVVAFPCVGASSGVNGAARRRSRTPSRRAGPTAAASPKSPGVVRAPGMIFESPEWSEGG
jgi:hypothetical protein